MSTFRLSPQVRVIRLQRVEFEVFGKVQKVFFRKHTRQTAETLELRGWCMNSSNGTVVGVLEGPSDKILLMKRWLRQTGSPKSKIDKAEFKNEKDIQKFSFDKFNIRK